MKKLFFSLIAILAMAACSSHVSDKTLINPDDVDDSAPADSAVFNMGRQVAAALLDNCTTMAEVEAEILDVKARIHLINTRIGRQEAEDFTKGFKAYIIANNDSLARLIF